MKQGKVFLVGAGPGDPDLITVKGLRAIQAADVILYDRLINDDLLQAAKTNAQLVYCGKLPNDHWMRQEAINQFLIKHVKNGKVVTRLKGGDPFVFGRGGEEAEALAKHDIPFEIIPGITAGIAVPAYAGIPVTHREHSSSFALVTGHRHTNSSDHIHWESLAKGIDTVVFYMGVKNLPTIQEKMLEHGRDEMTPVAFIHWGTTKDQRTLIGTLGNIVEKVREENVKNPAIIVIGDVVTLSNQLTWFEQLRDHVTTDEVIHSVI